MLAWCSAVRVLLLLHQTAAGHSFYRKCDQSGARLRLDKCVSSDVPVPTETDPHPLTDIDALVGDPCRLDVAHGHRIAASATRVASHLLDRTTGPIRATVLASAP